MPNSNRDRDARKVAYSLSTLDLAVRLGELTDRFMSDMELTEVERNLVIRTTDELMLLLMGRIEDSFREPAVRAAVSGVVARAMEGVAER